MRSKHSPYINSVPLLPSSGLKIRCPSKVLSSCKYDRCSSKMYETEQYFSTPNFSLPKRRTCFIIFVCGAKGRKLGGLSTNPELRNAFRENLTWSQNKNVYGDERHFSLLKTTWAEFFWVLSASSTSLWEGKRVGQEGKLTTIYTIYEPSFCSLSFSWQKTDWNYP